MENVSLNLEGVFAAVSWLANANGLQHPCVPQLPEHQAVVEPQGQLEGEKQANDEQIFPLTEAFKHTDG